MYVCTLHDVLTRRSCNNAFGVASNVGYEHDKRANFKCKVAVPNFVSLM